MKKKLLTFVSFVAVAAMAVAGTVAYFTDTDSDVNVMTLGNVNITQNEQQRVEENGEFTSVLEDFEQGKILLPVTYDRSASADEVTVGDYTLTLSDDENNYVDKIISVTNDGKTDAYVRTLVAVPTGGADWESTPVSANNCWLHWNIPAGYSTYWTLVSSNVPMVEINGEGYYIWEFIHKEIVEPGKTTFPMVRGFYMDKRVDNDDNGYYMTYADGTVKRIEDVKLDDTVDILVVSQAVQADGFKDAANALDEAFGDITATNNPWVNVPTNVKTFEELKTALSAGKAVVLENDIVGDGETIVIPGNATSSIDLNGKKLTNTVSGAPAILNYGDLTITGDGSIENNTSDTAKSHTIRNFGTLTINGGNIGTFATSGAAIVNDGTATINGGTFASRQESNEQYGKGPAAYCLINNSGTMTINSATVNGPTHGIFAAYAGELIVNDGTYTLVGNKGMGCYVAYSNGNGVVTLNGGTINTNEPRHNRVFFVYDNGKNYFNAAAVETGYIVVDEATIYLNGAEQSY